jgi:hypothetical protein
MRRLALVGVIVSATALAISGCGSSDDDDAGAAPTTAPTTTPTETSGGIDPLEGASTNPASGPVQTVTGPGGATALLERVAVARHEGYDRVVFEFRNILPGYRVEYLEPPLKEDGSGAIVKVEGTAFVSVRMEPASGFDLNTGEGVQVYKGPRRISGAEAGTPVVREVVRTGDFEAVLTWAIGLGDPVDFRVQTLDDPPRLVVDFRNH